MTNNLFLIAYALINLLDPSRDVDPGESWFELAISLSMLAGLAGVFAKAGRPWYAALVPIYAELTLLRIMEKPWWWLLLLVIPCVGTIAQIVVLVLLLERFRKGIGWLIGMIFIPFVMLPILGFGSAEYHAPFHRKRARVGRAPTASSE